MTAGAAVLHGCVRSRPRPGTLGQLHHGCMRELAVTHTVMSMMWILAPAECRVENKPDWHKQTVAMATTNHFTLELINILVLSAGFSKPLQTMLASCLLDFNKYIMYDSSNRTNSNVHMEKISPELDQGSSPAACQTDNK